MTGVGLGWEILIIGILLLGSFGGFVALLQIIGENTMRAKQFAVGLGITLLLPLSVHYGAEMIRPSPKEDVHYEQLHKLEAQRVATKSKEEKAKLTAQKSALEKEHKEKKKKHAELLFMVGYPVAIAAIILGAFITIPAVGAGLMFGGIITLTDACFSYWEVMASWLRFTSLLGALFILIVLGCWNLAGGPAEQQPTNPK